MPATPLLTVSEVAAEFQVTAQTIRNWIDHGALPAVRIGRGYRIRREDVDALLTHASAESSSLATRRDVWTPENTSLPRRHNRGDHGSVWETRDATLPIKSR
jgi:excisionase family DNA binding protein